MKNFLLPVLAAMLMIPTACSKSGHAEPPEPLPRGPSYFYIQNDWDQDMQFLTRGSSQDPNDPILPATFQVNRYMKILLPAKTKTLIRVFQSPENVEPFNCFYYGDITGGCTVWIGPLNNDNVHTDDLWSYEYWHYTRTGQWTAEYVMTVDHDIWNDW